MEMETMLESESESESELFDSDLDSEDFEYEYDFEDDVVEEEMSRDEIIRELQKTIADGYEARQVLLRMTA